MRGRSYQVPRVPCRNVRCVNKCVSHVRTCVYACVRMRAQEGIHSLKHLVGARIARRYVENITLKCVTGAHMTHKIQTHALLDQCVGVRGGRGLRGWRDGK